MAYASWNPFAEIDGMRREIDRIFEGHGLSRWSFPFSRFSFLPGRSARAYPLINIAEDEQAYTVEALAPGLETGTLKISVVNGQLVMEGQKAEARKGLKPEAYHRNERSAGTFRRTVQLPGEIDAERVTAEYRNGLLRVTLPKAEAAKPRQITVNVA